ncbi:MAG: hypothetical protein CVT64_09720 [Actinobacteria bacterium HGW-Actinobacteria-4]|nr:MAG: hypothetical protein CVT64_09720 [Actinobacteria bacterium HGW-Actinobacteria-4]
MGREADPEVPVNSSRGPIAGRIKRPTWRDPKLLVGLALIAFSVVAVATVVQSADITSPYYSARHTLTPGTVLTESDVILTHVRVGTGTYLSADADPPWGQVVTRVVGTGELIPASSLLDQAQFDARPVAVRTSLPLGEAITRGSIVDVWLTLDTEDGPESSPIAQGLVVEQVDRAGGAFSVANSETVYVVVPGDQVAAFLDAIASKGDISVVGLAGAGAS